MAWHGGESNTSASERERIARFNRSCLGSAHSGAIPLHPCAVISLVFLHIQRTIFAVCKIPIAMIMIEIIGKHRDVSGTLKLAGRLG